MYEDFAEDERHRRRRLPGSEQRRHPGHGARPATADGALVTGSFFRVLGVRAGRWPAARRGTTTGPGAPPVVVLSHRLWQRAFAGDPGVVGPSMAINGQSVHDRRRGAADFLRHAAGPVDRRLRARRTGSPTVPQFATESMLTTRSSGGCSWSRGRSRAPSRRASAGGAGARSSTRRVKPFITKPKQHAIFGLRLGRTGLRLR